MDASLLPGGHGGDGGRLPSPADVLRGDGPAVARGSGSRTPDAEASESQEATDQEQFDKLWAASLSLVVVGMPAGAALSAYLASCGYFALRFNSTVLFGLQNLVVYGITLLLIILQEAYDDSFDKLYGAHQTYGFRIIAVGFVASLFVLAVPMCQSPAWVLAAGAGLAFAAVAQSSAAMQLSAAMVRGGGLLVSFGLTLGSMLPLLVTPVVNFKPGCSFHEAMWFYGITCGVCVICTSCWAVEHSYASKLDGQEALAPEAEQLTASRSTSSQLVQSAYRALSEAELPPLEPAEETPRDKAARDCLRRLLSEGALGILVCMFTGFMAVPLFTLADPEVAQALYLMKCLGDFLGRVMAILHSMRCNSRGYVGPWIRHGSVLLVAVRVCLCAALMRWLLVHRGKQPTAALLQFTTVLIYSLGGYAMLMLDLDAQLEAQHRAGRKAAQRWNLVMMYSGQITGVVVGISLHWAQ